MPKSQNIKLQLLRGQSHNSPILCRGLLAQANLAIRLQSQAMELIRSIPTTMINLTEKALCKHSASAAFEFYFNSI